MSIVKTPREIARDLRDNGMRCFCDLDNWQPEISTGHSWVCPIHKIAIEKTKETANE